MAVTQCIVSRRDNDCTVPQQTLVWCCDAWTSMYYADVHVRWSLVEVTRNLNLYGADKRRNFHLFIYEGKASPVHPMGVH